MLNGNRCPFNNRFSKKDVIISLYEISPVHISKIVKPFYDYLYIAQEQLPIIIQ